MGRSAVSVQGRLFPWLRKAIILAVCGALVIVALLGAVANVTRSADPQTAMQLWPWDGLAPAMVADNLVGESPGLVPSQRAIALALQSLSVVAINPRALRILGFSAEANGDIDSAKKLIGLSARTSRRDMAAQLWLIEDSVRQSDVRGTLAHYDVALRANAQSRDLLLPILTNALVDGELRRALAPYIRVGVPWLYPFLTYAVANSKQPSSVAATLELSGGMPADLIYRDLESQLLVQLVASGDFVAARRYYATLRGAAQSIFAYAGFSAATTDQHFAPITWQLGGSSAIGAGFEGVTDQASQVRVYANSGERGIVLRRLLFLPPGRYIYSEVRKPVQAGADAEAYWEMRCTNGEKRALWQSDRAATFAGNQVAELTIPQSCEQQYLELMAAGGSDQAGMEFLITSFSVTPTNQVAGTGV